MPEALSTVERLRAISARIPYRIELSREPGGTEIVRLYTPDGFRIATQIASTFLAEMEAKP